MTIFKLYICIPWSVFYFFLLGMSVLNLTSITAKIGLSNTNSQALFSKFGFEEVSLI